MATKTPKGTLPPYNTAASPDMLGLQGEPRVSFTGVTTRCFPLKASMNTLQDFCDNYLNFPDDGPIMKASQENYFRPALPYVYFQMINYGKMATESENLGWIAQNEILFLVPLEWYKVERGKLVFHDWAMICPFIFVDNDMSLTTGREAYGWCKVRGWLDWVPTSWTKDPRSPRRLLSMGTEVYPDLYSGATQEARTLIEVSQHQVPPLSPSLLTRRNPFNPLWGLPNAVRGSLSLMGDMFEVATNLPILGYRRRNLASLSRMSSRALGNMRAMVPWLPFGPAQAPRKSEDGKLIKDTSSPNLYFNQLTLKQFRDASAPDDACYQAVVNSKVTVDHYYDVGLLGAPNLMVGDLSGGFTLDVHEYPEQPIVQTLGIEVASRSSDDRNPPVATLKPVMPFWMSCDLRYDTGTTVAWRGKHSPVWNENRFYKRESAKEPAEGDGSLNANKFNNTRGPAIQEVPGPFNYPDATLRVFPLMADPDKLQKFCDEYLNTLDGDQTSGVMGQTFDAWGSYVYMVVTSYGDEEGGKMYGEKNNIGQIADRQVSFHVPVRWMESGGDDANLKSFGLLTPYIFASSSRHVISEREINGRQAVHSVIKSDDESWLRESGPVRSRMLAVVRTLLIPSLNVGQPAKMLDLIEITEKNVEKYNEDIPWAVIRANWEPHLREDLERKTSERKRILEEDKWNDIVQLFKNICPNRVDLNFLSLKQYRGTEWTDKSCYQALVLLKKKIEKIFDIREIHKDLHVKIHQYPTMPIVKTLGLKVKATDSKGTSIVDYLEPIRPFFMRVSLRDELGLKICSRVNGKKWATAKSDDDHYDHPGLNEVEQPLMDMVTEPKAIIEDLLTKKYAAHNSKYHKYDEDAEHYPYFVKPHFGMMANPNEEVLKVNRRTDDNN
jgi:hypothetical protein